MTENHPLLKKLYSLLHGAMTRDLSRIQELVESLGIPQNSYPIIHIGGTNGKGSVCSFVSSILQESGMKVGLYTSPHIFEFNERIRINNKLISDEEIEKYYAKIEKLSDKINASFFEITTAIAFEHFRANNVDIAVIEVGLGGRLDSTNIVNPIMSIITKIGKDHGYLLGDTIEKIAKEKAAIIKPDSFVVVQDVAPQIINIFQNEALKKNAFLYFGYELPEIYILGFSEEMKMYLNISMPDNLENFLNIAINADIDVPLEEYLSSVDKEYARVTTPHLVIVEMVGSHQVSNIKTSIFATLLLAMDRNYGITTNSIIAGLENVVKNTGISCRTQRICKEPCIVVDVAHNPDAIEAMTSTIRTATLYDKWDIVFGAMKDKDIEGMLEKMKPLCNKLYLVKPEVDRAADTNDIKQIAEKLGYDNVIESELIEDAIYSVITEKIESDSNENTPTLICGSFYVVSEALSEIKKILEI